MKILSAHRLILFFVVIVSLLNPSCERNENVNIEGFSCSDCFQSRPDWVRLNITFTINSENPFVPLVVYIGNVEDGNVDWIDTTFNTNYWVEVRPDRYYSVRAEYKEGSTTVFAVDGDDIKLAENTTDCNAPCFYTKGGYLDVRLK
jgi:hypothetical protein